MAWMTAVRDHPDRPPALQAHVLLLLALRMDWQTGCGFAATSQLAADAQCQERTVKNATRWGREHEMLVRSRRGHRLGDGRTVASEWRLTVPSQGLTGDTLNGISTGAGIPVETFSRGTGTSLNGQMSASQGARTDPPSRTSSSRTSSSARGDGAKAPRPPHATPENPPPRVPPCPECGEPFTAEDLRGDPDNYAMAMRGEIIHARCIEREPARPGYGS
jgi:hypothetical protein